MVTELFLTSGPPLLSQTSSQCAIRSKSLKCRSQCPTVLGGDQITRDVVEHHLPGPSMSKLTTGLPAKSP